MATKKKRRRQRGEGSVFQRADGIWVAKVDLGWRDGKRVRPTVYAPTQAKAIDKLNELKQRVAETGGAPPSKRVRVADWLTYWVDEVVAPNEKPNTVAFYRTNVNTHLIPALGQTWLHQLQPEDVEAMHKAVLAKKWRGRRLSSTTAYHAHQTLHAALEAARRRRRVTYNVAELVTPPSRARNDRGALTATQARTLLSRHADNRMSSRWMAALLTGARQGELLGLETDRVDLDRGVLYLSWGLDALPFRHGCGDQTDDAWPCGRKRAGSCPHRQIDVPHGYKHRQLRGALCLVADLKTTASTRAVPIVAPLDAALRKRLNEIENERAHYAADHGLVWCRPDGQPIVAKEDTAAWKQACRAAGVPVVDLHAARHSTATLLLEAGVDTKVVQQIVGHSTAATTQAYQHVDLELARRGLQALADLIELE